MSADPLSERFLDSSEEVGTATHAVFIPGPAFGGDEADKAAQLERAVEHREQERRPSAPLFGPWVPRGLSALQGRLIGKRQGVLKPDVARGFAVRIVEATPVGADLRGVWWRWVDWAFHHAPSSIRSRLEAEHLTEIAESASGWIRRAVEYGPTWKLADSEAKAIRRDCYIERYSRKVGSLEWERSYALWATSSFLYSDEREAGYAVRYVLEAGVDPVDAVERLIHELEHAPQWAEVPA